jgi:ABC-type nitrate/sulfonate/bicarbonate transport system substrate-binding protein
MVAMQHAKLHGITRRQSLTFAAATAIGALAPNLARAQAVPTIRIGQNVAETFGEGLYGVDGGLFAAAGLNVEVSTFPNGAAQASACIGGAIDVGLGEATELANGVVHGLPLAIFAGGALYETAAPSTLLCVAANSTFRVAKDFEGQTIAVPAITALSAMAVKAWLVKNGANVARVNFIELPASATLAALERGTIAAAHYGEPYLSAAGTAVRRIAAPYDAVGKRFLISDWFSTRGWLTANPALAKRLTGALGKRPS